MTETQNDICEKHQIYLISLLFRTRSIFGLYFLCLQFQRLYTVGSIELEPCNFDVDKGFSRVRLFHSSTDNFCCLIRWTISQT